MCAIGRGLLARRRLRCCTGVPAGVRKLGLPGCELPHLPYCILHLPHILQAYPAAAASVHACVTRIKMWLTVAMFLNRSYLREPAPNSDLVVQGQALDGRAAL